MVILWNVKKLISAPQRHYFGNGSMFRNDIKFRGKLAVHEFVLVSVADLSTLFAYINCSA
jgi:hypothetical protein